MRKKQAYEPIEWPGLADQVLKMEKAGLVTRTFRRLDPERQNSIIAAILDEAAERGLAETDIKQVAARAKISIGSLYQYFGNRAGMLEFTVQLCLEYMTGVLELSLPYLENLPFADALAAYVSGGSDWASSQTSLTKLFARAAYHGDSELTERLVRPVASRMRAIVRALLERAIERGEIRDDLDIELSASLLHALTIVVADTKILPPLDAYFQLTHGGSKSQPELNCLLDLITAGMRTHPTSAGQVKGR